MDRSSNESGCVMDLIFSFPEPECLKIEYALRFRFKASNNEAKYETCKVMTSTSDESLIVGYL